MSNFDDLRKLNLNVSFAQLQSQLVQSFSDFNYWSAWGLVWEKTITKMGFYTYSTPPKQTSGWKGTYVVRRREPSYDVATLHMMAQMDFWQNSTLFLVPQSSVLQNSAIFEYDQADHFQPSSCFLIKVILWLKILFLIQLTTRLHFLSDLNHVLI